MMIFLEREDVDGKRKEEHDKRADYMSFSMNGGINFSSLLVRSPNFGNSGSVVSLRYYFIILTTDSPWACRTFMRCSSLPGMPVSLISTLFFPSPAIVETSMPETS